MQPAALLAPLLWLTLVCARLAPDESHVRRELRGWTVWVERSLVEAEAELGRRTLELLDVELFEIARAVPEPALAKLCAIPIWVSRADPVRPCMCYHPSAEWLREHGFDARKAKGVEIANAEAFLEWTRGQPMMVLHELAHGYHDQHFGYDDERIESAWRAAVESGRYTSVLRYRGDREPHYAATDPMEYFAEASEAWFGTNDYFPFVRAELSESDPRTAELMRALWGG